jgi:hypothetical protein
LDSDCVAQPHDSHHHHIHQMHTHGTSALPTATGRLLRQRHRCVLDRCISRASSAPSSGGVVYGGRRSRRHHCDMSPSMVDTPPSSDLPFYGVVKNIIESQVPNLYSANQPQRGRMMSAFDRCSHGCCDGSILVPSSLHYACPQEDTAELCGADIRATACSFQQGIRMCFADPTTDCRSSFSVAPVKHIRPSSS